MAKEILMRAGKDPRTPVDAYETFTSNLIGNNNGNLMFATASHKLLSTSEQNVTAHGLSFHPNQADRINEKFDHLVLPLANAFRKSFEPQLIKLTELILKLDIPVTMLSGGAQSGGDGSFANLNSIADSVKRFCSAVLDRSPRLSVRGEQTGRYLNSLGIRDVEVIGCPSLTMHGPGHSVRPVDTSSLSRVAYNVETSKDICGHLVADAELHYDARYYAQDMSTFELMLHGIDRFASERDSRLPLRSTHPAFKEDRARFALDAWTWIDALKKADFSFGPRIHGAVASILAGTPAMLIAHDSRTVELAEVHGIPYLELQDISEDLTVQDLALMTDYSKFNKMHTQYVDRIVSFAHAHGLETIYDSDQASVLKSYNSQVENVAFPSVMHTVWSSKTEDIRARLAHARGLELQVENSRKELVALRSEINAIKRGLALAGKKR